MKPNICRLLVLIVSNCLLNHASGEEFTFENFTCDDLGSTISIINYPDSAVGSVVIPESINRFGVEKPVTVIEVVAFDDVIGITDMVIPDSVTSIGSDAFARCSGLMSIKLPSSLVALGANAFRDCTGITGVTLPASLSMIEESLFEGCSNLTNLEIPQGVVSIGPRAFAQCDRLGSISIPHGVEAIQNSTFEGCDRLRGVNLPASVIEIASFAFADCDSLATFTIPSTVTVLGNSVFDVCSLLKSVVFLGNAPTMGDTVFESQSINPTLRIYFFNGKDGFTEPLWLPIVNQPPYASINMGSESPITPWLILNNLPINSNLEEDTNGDGVSLLMAYALNLDPNKSLGGSLVRPVYENNQMSMSFYAGSAGVSYRVETCTDLMSWTSAGVNLSLPDASQFRIATVPMSGAQRFMRLVVVR